LAQRSARAAAQLVDALAEALGTALPWASAPSPAEPFGLHASLLVQVGLLDRGDLPITGAEQAENLFDPRARVANAGRSFSGLQPRAVRPLGYRLIPAVAKPRPACVRSPRGSRPPAVPR
jgi:hypothetical protein